MFTLAHFSDPHIAPLPAPRFNELLSKRITGYVNYRRNRKGALTGSVLDDLLSDLKQQSPDHIALTGDLVNIALDEEISNAKAWLETVGPGDKVSLVPGNHDAYVVGALEKAMQAWKPYFQGDNATMKEAVTFPYVRKRGALAIIALSTALPTPPFMATGTLGKTQIEQASEKLKAVSGDKCFRVVLIHHPPFVENGRWFKRLTDHANFTAMIAQCGADLILHGHTHRRNVTQINGPDGSVPVVGVPSASSGLSGKHEASRYNLFNIERSNNKWQCLHIERGITPSGRFAELDRRLL